MTKIRITADLDIIEIPELNLDLQPLQDSGKGALCEDGSTSSSTGSGTCAWHGGVKEWKE